MQLKLEFFILFLSTFTLVSPLPLKIKENNPQLKDEKYNHPFRKYDWILNRKKRYSPFYKRNYFQFNVPLSEKNSITTTPLPTTKLNDPGNVSSQFYVSLYLIPNNT